MLFLLTVFSVLTNNSWGQIIDPADKVNCEFSIEQDGEDAIVIVKVTVLDGFHINAANLPEGAFSLPTTLDFPSSPNYLVEGKVVEPKFHIVYDEIAEEYIHYHTGKIEFKRGLKIISENEFTLKGEFEFQVCTDEICLRPVMIDFELEVKEVKMINNNN